MKRGIISYLIEIIITIGLIAFSYYLITNCQLNKLDKEFIEDKNISINVTNNNNSLKPMSDSYALNNLDNTIIKVKNYNDNEVDYKLFMRIKKGNELDFEQLKIKVDNDVFRLNTKYDYEDEEYLYFDLTHKKIDDSNNVNFAMWLDENIENYNNYSFSYNFYIERI